MTRDHLPIVAQEGLNIDELNEVICDDSPVMLRRYRSSHYTGLLPVLLFMHPGGFVNGGLETEDALCRKLALHVPIVVLSVEYRLAPEHPFPAGFNDCLAAVKWVGRSVMSIAAATDSLEGHFTIRTELSGGRPGQRLHLGRPFCRR